jgi:hypothetical protein
MVTDYIRHLQRKNEPLGGISAPRPAQGETGEDWDKVLAEGRAKRARRQEKEREATPAGKSASIDRSEPAPAVRREPGPPALSHEQSVAQRALFRHACDWLELHHLCSNTDCNRAKRCRGEAVACLRAAIPHVPESARQFVRSMIEGQELGLSFEEAFEDAEELADGWEAWIAGLQAASKAGTRVKRPKIRP